MSKNAERMIKVWADWVLLDGPIFMGALFARPSRGREIVSFEYDADWLAGAHAQSLGPSTTKRPR